MKFSKIRLIQISSVAALSLVIGLLAVNIDTNDSDSKVLVNTKTPSAGVVSELNNNLVSKSSLYAGVSAELADSANVTVEKNSTNLVASAQSDDGTICGYKNLGIADISEGNLNVRKKADASSKAIGKMTKHNACEIIKKSGDWYKVKSGSVTGYVKAEYLLTGDKALEVAKKEVQLIATVENTQTLRVRKKPSADSKTLSLIGEGEDLVIVDQTDGWYKVEIDDDEEGYISSDYASVSEKLPTAKSVKEVSSGKNGVSDTRSALVAYALQFVGNRYVWGGTSLTNGIDCSGFTMQVYARFGIGLPHHAASQPARGKRISAAQARPGDLFFYGSGRIGHVAIYIGNGQIVHAANKRSGIIISNAYYSRPVCVVSYLN